MPAQARRAGARIAVPAPTPESPAFHAALGFVLRAYPAGRTYHLAPATDA